MVEKLYQEDSDTAIEKRKSAALDIIFDAGDEIECIHWPEWWMVPSASQHLRYRVNLSYKTCQCPDNKYRHNLCKHYWAARITRNLVKVMREIEEVA